MIPPAALPPPEDERGGPIETAALPGARLAAGPAPAPAAPVGLIGRAGRRAGSG